MVRAFSLKMIFTVLKQILSLNPPLLCCDTNEGIFTSHNDPIDFEVDPWVIHKLRGLGGMGGVAN